MMRLSNFVHLKGFLSNPTTMYKLLSVVVLFISLSFLVHADLIFFDHFNSGNAFDNGWSSVTGTMTESGTVINSINTNDAMIGQNFTNISYLEDFNISFVGSANVILGGQGTRMYLSQESGTPVNYISTFMYYSSGVKIALDCGGSCSCTNSGGISSGSASEISLVYDSDTNNISMQDDGVMVYNTTLSGCNLSNFDAKLLSQDTTLQIGQFELRNDSINPVTAPPVSFLYELTDYGWHIYDNFTQDNTDMYYYDGTGTQNPDEFYCPDNGAGFIIVNESFKINPQGRIEIYANYSTSIAGNDDANTWGVWVLQNYNDTKSPGIENSTTKYIQIWHRNRGGDTQGSQRLRIWNGSVIENLDDGWSASNGHGIKSDQIMFYNMSSLGNGSYSLIFKDNGVTEDSYISSVHTTDTFNGEDNYYLYFDCRYNTGDSELIMDSMEIFYYQPTGLDFILNLITPLNDSVLTYSDLPGLTIELDNDNNNIISSCDTNSTYFNVTSISGKYANLTGVGYLNGQHDFIVNCNDTNSFNDSIDISYFFDLNNISLSIDYPTNATLLDDTNFNNGTIQLTANRDIDDCSLNDTTYFNVSSIISDVVKLFTATFINSSDNHSFNLNCNDTLSGSNDSINLNYYNVIPNLVLSLVSPLNNSVLNIGVAELDNVLSVTPKGKNVSDCNVTDTTGDIWNTISLNPTINITNNATTIGLHILTVSCNDTQGQIDNILYSFTVSAVPVAPTEIELDLTGLNNSVIFIGAILFIALLFVSGVMFRAKVLLVGASLMGFIFGIWIINNLTLPSLFGIIVSTMSAYFMFVVVKGE